MTARHHDQVEIQEELMTSLLEGEEPDCWVVMPASALVTQMTIAIRETRSRAGDARPGLASARLIRNLATLGFTRNTIYNKQVDQ